MEKFRHFWRDKAFLWVIAACVAAAALVGVWAVRTVQQDMADSRAQDGVSGSDDAGLEVYPGLENDTGMEADEWNMDMGVAGNAEGVPEDSSASSGQPASSASASGSGSGSPSGSGQGGSGKPAAAAAPSYTQPVSGSVRKAYSGDELVYSSTLADWRTHNGVDYGCATGEAVFAPASGTVARVAVDGNWGGLVELTDAEGRTWRLCGVTAAVAQGDAVVTGQQLGTASVIGCENADGAHVHLEVLQGGKYIDPAALLG